MDIIFTIGLSKIIFQKDSKFYVGIVIVGKPIMGEFVLMSISRKVYKLLLRTLSKEELEIRLKMGDC